MSVKLPLLTGGPTSKNLFWLDLESTGLRVESDIILEVAALVTDPHMKVLDTFHAVIHVSEDELEKHTTHWSKEHHSHGLIQEVAQSDESFDQVQDRFVTFLDKHREGKKVVLAGSSVTFDRDLLRARMPKVVDRLHYRVVDVSTLLEIAKRFYPQLYPWTPPKCEIHRAMADAQSSLQLYQFYLRNMFIPPLSSIYRG